MTAILTVPDRLVLMALDATLLVADASNHLPKSIDSVRRPFVYIEVGQGDYPPVASSVEEPTEEFTLSIIAQKYGQEGKGEAEDELRQVTAAILTYFYARPGLQMSNALGRNTGGALPALAHTQWARIFMRTFCGVVTQQQPGDGEGPFWGTSLSIRVNSSFPVLEVIVSSDVS